MKMYVSVDDLFTQIPIHVSGVAVSNPVWVIHPSIDLKICTFDCLYQYTIVLQSRWVQKTDKVENITELFFFTCKQKTAVQSKQ